MPGADLLPRPAHSPASLSDARGWEETFQLLRRTDPKAAPRSTSGAG